MIRRWLFQFLCGITLHHPVVNGERRRHRGHHYIRTGWAGDTITPRDTWRCTYCGHECETR